VFFFGGFLSLFLLFVVKEVAVKGEFVLLIFQREREREREIMDGLVVVVLLVFCM
jgi:hypothetical protein